MADELRQAASLIVGREGSGGLELLVIERSRGSGASAVPVVPGFQKERFEGAAVFVLPNPSSWYLPPPSGYVEGLRRDAEAHLCDLLAPAERSRFHVQSAVLFGDAPEGILEYAGRESIDLIIMGTHGRGGVAHAIMGSVAEKVVRTAPCPVLTVR